MNEQFGQLGKLGEEIAKLGIEANNENIRAVQNNLDRRSKPPLPIMAGLIEPPHVLVAMTEQELIQYHQRESGTNKKSQTIQTITLLAPITHGIAPSFIDLQPITIQEAIMHVNTIHTGRVLFVKTIRKSFRKVGTALLVEDSNDDLIMLYVYNFVSPEENPQLVFPCGTFIAILEPYLRFSMDNPKLPVMIRTDNPQSIIIFESDKEWFLAKRGIFQEYKLTITAFNAESEADTMCVQGNKLYAKGEYKLALKYYNKGLQLFPCSVRILSNRAAAHMSMESWSLALQNVEAVLIIDPSHIKCLYRRASIFLNLQQPTLAKKVLDSLIQDLVSNKTSDCFADNIKFEATSRDIQIAIREQRGVYDLKTMMIESNHKHEGPSKKLSRKHMDYTNSHIEMKHIKGKGNGMVSTKDLATSELIMVSKALVFAQFNSKELSNSLSANTDFRMTNHSNKMLPYLVEELILHPDCGAELYSLSAGSKYPNSVLPENYSKVDILRMTAILTSNWFGADTSVMRRIVTSQRKRSIEGSIDNDQSKVGTGLWLRSSKLNHSCMPNCTYFIIGDFHFIITNRPVATGEELTIPYCDITKSFADRSKTFKNWNNGDGFDCLCERCLYSRQNPAIVAIDVEIEKAYSEATKLSHQGYSMGQAADKALPISRRKVIISHLEKVPLIAQGNLSKVYELESISQGHAGRSLEALSITQKNLEAELKFSGVGPQSRELLVAYFGIVTFATDLHKLDLAKATLMTVYTIFCCPPWGQLTKEELKLLCQCYTAEDQHSIICHIVDGLEFKSHGNDIVDKKNSNK